MMYLREYNECDEQGWVRCRVLSFLDSAYFDDVHREKETYENPSIELVAEDDGNIVGLIDVELDTGERPVCSGDETGGMIWHLAVHPDFQRRGIATDLFNEASRHAKAEGIECFEAWTRDDEATVSWYEKMGFDRCESYLHVYLSRKDAECVCPSAVDGLSVNTAFAQYVGNDEDRIREQFDRVHDCQQFLRNI